MGPAALLRVCSIFFSSHPEFSRMEESQLV